MSGNQIAVTSIGAGYNSFTTNACPSAFANSSGQTTTTPVGTSITVEVCCSYASLCKALRMSERFAVADVFQESAIAGSNVIMTTTFVAIVIRAASSVAMAYDSVPAMATSVQPPSTVKEANSFCQTYGDSYVSSVELGHAYVAAYVFYCQTADEQRALLTSLSSMNGALSASTATALTAACKNSVTSWTCHQQALGAGNASLPPPYDAAAVVAFAMAFPETSASAPPVIISFATAGYETLAAFQGANALAAFAPVVANRTAFDTTVTPAALALIGVQNQIAAIRDVYVTYGGFNDRALVVNGQAIASSLQRLKNWVHAVGLNATSNPVHAADVQHVNMALAYGSPNLRYRTSTPQSFGSVGGAAFADINVTNAAALDSGSSTPIPILQLPVLVSIQLFGSSAVGEMKCTYTTNAPRHTYIFTHGSTNNSGGWGATLNLQTNEFITHINGSMTNCVTRLSFVTSLGQTMTFPPGMGTGTEFQWAVPSGWTLVGFQGFSGWDLDRLTPILISFEPASWTPTHATRIPLPPDSSTALPGVPAPSASESASPAPMTVTLGPSTTNAGQTEYVSITVTGSTISVTAARGPGAIPNPGSVVTGAN